MGTGESRDRSVPGDLLDPTCGRDSSDADAQTGATTDPSAAWMLAGDGPYSHAELVGLLADIPEELSAFAIFRS